ncbi:MAG: FAD-dependent oxidoreductase [Deltaproteobacteria bacterium]|nr:FAD-dependent oxidoreductase [Deltaproteobacteria bacterium]
MGYVIVGCGIAGISAIETLRKYDQKCSITVISDEKEPLYSRPLMSKVLSPRSAVGNIFIRDRDFFTKNNVWALLGEKVEEVDPEKREIRLRSGKKIQYEKLLLATGASPLIPKIEGIDRKMVFPFRQLEDAIRLKEALKNAKNVLIVGGGPVGLELAYTLAKEGVKIKLIEMGRNLVPQLFDQAGSAILEKKLSSAGIELHIGKTLKGLEGSIMRNRVKYAILSDGSVIDTDLVILATGVKPNIELAVKSAISVGNGIYVDDHLETSIKGIYAAGDVAESKDLLSSSYTLSPFWISASTQGKYAALNMLGRNVPYKETLAFQGTLRFDDVPVAFAGTLVYDRSFQEIALGPRNNVYKKIWFVNGKVSGFLFVGDIRNAGLIRSIILKRIDIPAFRERLLDPDFSYAYFLKKEVEMSKNWL